MTSFQMRKKELLFCLIFYWPTFRRVFHLSTRIIVVNERLFASLNDILKLVAELYSEIVHTSAYFLE